MNTDHNRLSDTPFFTSPSFELWQASLNDHSTSFLKRLPVSYRQDAGRVEQFAQEHSYATALNPPHWPEFNRSVIDGRETIFQFHTGNAMSLHQLVRDGMLWKKPLPLPIGIRLLKQILETFLFVERHVESNSNPPIFLELNPGAIFVDTEGCIRFCHIGFGTPPALYTSIIRPKDRNYFIYAAPEQCIHGRSPARRTAAYSLGLICFELLSGKLLFSNGRSDPLDLIVNRKVRNLHPMVSDVRANLRSMDSIVSALLNPLPEGRLQDFHRVAAAIDSLSTSECRSSDESFRQYVESLKQLETEHRNRMLSNDFRDTLTQVTDITELNAS